MCSTRGHAEGLSYFPRGESLGVVLPSNSPGVHSLWAPAFALKTPLVLKPGGRAVDALPHDPGADPCGSAAGCFRILPGRSRGRGRDPAPLRARAWYSAMYLPRGMWQGDARIEVHGPGYSKIVIGEDCIGDWEQYLDVMVSSILENSGRSCINASGVWVPSHAAEIAEALAARLATVAPRDEATMRARRSRRSPMPRWQSASRRRLTANWMARPRATLRPRIGRARGWLDSKAAHTCCPPSCCATRPRIRWPIGNSCFHSPASFR
jgi:hypothetical protein